MTKIYYESDADMSVLDGQSVAVVGYGNQGRSWAPNLRGSGLPVEGRTLAVGRALGGLRQGAIEMTPRQEAILDLAVEQVLAPAMGRVSMSFVALMSGAGVPLEAIMAELMLSGEIERSYRLLRLEGYAGQMRYHSPTSQYGQMSRANRYDGLD